MIKLLLRLSYLLCLCLSTQVLASAEQIIHFGSNIQVNTDQSLSVTETISIYMEPEHLVQDMQRELPLQLQDQNLNYQINQILLNGEPIAYETTKTDDSLKLVFDNEAVFEPGIYVYTLSYQVKNLDLQNKQFVWNVTGNHWNIPILKAEADVIFPDNSKVLNYKSVANTADLKQFPGQSRQLSQNKFSFATKNALKPGESFIINVNWAGSGIGSGERASTALFASNKFIFLSFVVLFTVLTASLFIWLLYKHRIVKKNNHRTIEPRYSKLHFSIGVFLTLCTMLLALFTTNYKLTMFYSFLWIIGWTIICYFLLHRVKTGMQVVKRNPSNGNIFGMVFFSTFAFPFFIAELIGIYVFSALIPPALLVTVLLLVILNLITYHCLFGPKSVTTTQIQQDAV